MGRQKANTVSDGRLPKAKKANATSLPVRDLGYAFTYIVGSDFEQGNRKGRQRVSLRPSSVSILRYVNWNLSPIVANAYDDNGFITDANVLINAKTNRYELSLPRGFP